MWRWFNPVECEVAEQCLARGNVLEAARVLLASADREHRAVRELRLRLGPQLAEQARQTHADGDCLLAAELIACAAECAELTPELRAFHDRVLAKRDELRQQGDWRRQRIDRAAEWARQGRLRSALGLVEPLEDHEAGRLRQDWLAACGQLDRYVAEFHRYLENGQVSAAEAMLRKARELAPQQPQVLVLEQALRAAQPTGSFVVEESIVLAEVDEIAEGQACPTYDRCVLSGLAGTGDVLVIARPVVTIGSHTADW